MIRTLLFASIIFLAYSAIDLEEIKFPDWPTYSFKTYSGLLSIAEDQRQLHYVFLESQNDPTTDPVVLWLNGGPGCSSMLGLLTELGPFLLPNGGGDFQANEYSWNKKANMIFLEAPAAVGFSVNTTEYVWSDANTAADSYEALKVWFQGFAEYQDRDFYITGESYGGMYVPFLAKAIVDGNANPETVKQIKLKGIAIGNGAMVWDEAFRSEALVQYLISRNLFDEQTAYVLNHQCAIDSSSASCLLAYSTLVKVMTNLNIYKIYGYCYQDSSFVNSGVRFPYTSWIKASNTQGAPCTDFTTISNYINQDTVKSALHVDNTITWEACNMNVNENYQSDSIGSYRVFPDLYNAGLKILVYSGDQDAAVSLTETMMSLPLIEGLEETKSWTAWGDGDTENEQLAGWTIEYNMLKLVIVRGSGHMVPEDQPKRAYLMYSDFLGVSEKKKEQASE